MSRFKAFLSLLFASVLIAIAVSVMTSGFLPFPSASQIPEETIFSDIEFAYDYKVELPPGHGLLRGNLVRSAEAPFERYRLILQQDGNLVLYSVEDGYIDSPRWYSGTNGEAVQAAIMQGDGNFVIYGYNDAIWDTGTAGNPGARLVVQQEDGNVVIYSPSNRPLWSAR